ncbi:SDR family oxidoreductase [Sphingomonas sp. 28-63-12]|uniref:SDR family NAD(P)-dependent oxidoreductase n=1 Tax=Sphingomonas sp. 28-63-12 TaxID=1970434 RepID=UPI000BCACAB1|nr:MAG: short-chain dehydrogenase [Sphingomonas sp. 28-63-12]
MADMALVTGASAGLGAHFALALAAQGHDVILTARRSDRLEALAAKIRDTFGTAAHVIPADLAQPDAVAGLMADIAALGLAVNLLINNAGFGARGDVASLDGAMQAEMVDVNCRALVELCHAVLPGMIQMRRGAILNVASTAAFQPGPWMAVYYASKAFVLSFSEALHEEVRRQGVHVTALCPGPTRTEFFEAAAMEDVFFRRFAAAPEPVVRDGLAALGINRAVKVSGLFNALLAAATRITPRWVTRRAAGAVQRARGR